MHAMEKRDCEHCLWMETVDGKLICIYNKPIYADEDCPSFDYFEPIEE